jgi:hypothetical protein
VLQHAPEQVVGVQIGHRLAVVGQLGGAAGSGVERLARVVAHILRDVDPLRRPARLRRTEEAREQVVPLTGFARSDRSDAHHHLFPCCRNSKGNAIHSRIVPGPAVTPVAVPAGCETLLAWPCPCS